jgi:dTMP kinase
MVGHRDFVPDDAAGPSPTPLPTGRRASLHRAYARAGLSDEVEGRGWAVGYTPSVTRSRAPDRGWFITIEGPEGAGKTTQAAVLGEHLVVAGLDVQLTREPGGTWLGERLRGVLLARTETTASTDPLTDALLFNAARRQLVAEVIEPALTAGRTILCARFADSTLAYQGYGAGVPLETLRGLAAAATDGLTPDLTILLDLPPEDGLARVAPDDITRFEAEFDLAFHRRVRAGFLALAAAEPARFVVVDARRPADLVALDVAAAAARLIGSDEPKPTASRTTG